MKKSLRFPKIEKKHILYVVFGALTTLVNYLLYFPLFYLIGLSALWSNIIAWFFAVIFSFFVNKIFVFNSLHMATKQILHEFVCFIGSRLLTGILETLILFVLVDLLNMSAFVWKLVISIFIVVCNYITSSLVFRRN